MNRENKRKLYQKGYYKTHPCNDSFTCKVCGRPVVSAGSGSNHRNHCPNCLSSLHLDIEPGDRESDCGGIMEPVGVWVRNKGEWATHPPLQTLRTFKFQSGRRGRRSHEAHVHRHAPAVKTAISAGTH